MIITDYRTDCIDLMTDLNSRYHITLTLTKFTPEKVGRKLLNLLLKQLNRVIYRKRYSDGKSFLTGVVVQEYSHCMETIHFHGLIEDEPYLPDLLRFDELVGKQIRDIRRSNPKYYITDHLVQEYVNDGDDKLERYLTKQFEFRGNRSLNNIGLLTCDDVIFGDVK